MGKSGENVLVTVRHPHGDITVLLSEWMNRGPGTRRHVDVVAARSLSGASLPLSTVPLRYRNNRRARLLRRVRLLPDPWVIVTPEVEEPKRYDLYGCALGSLDAVRELIEPGLRLNLKEHDSSYVGGIYLRAASWQEQITVVPNVPDDEGYYVDGGFDEWPFLVYISESTRWPELDTLLASIPSLVQLRTEVVSKPDGSSTADN